MTVRAYIATEGPHDVAFLAELLRPWGLKRLTKENEVDAFWVPLIPKTFPHKGDLLARVPRIRLIRGFLAELLRLPWPPAPPADNSGDAAAAQA